MQRRPPAPQRPLQPRQEPIELDDSGGFITPSATEFTVLGGHPHSTRDGDFCENQRMSMAMLMGGHSTASSTILGGSAISEAPILDRKRTLSSAMAVGFDSSAITIVDTNEKVLGGEDPSQSVVSNATDAPPLSASRLARATRHMDLNELHHLRDWLAKSAVHESSFVNLNASTRDPKWGVGTSDRPTMGPLGMSQLSSFGGGHHRKGASMVPSFQDVTGSHANIFETSMHMGRDSETAMRPTILTATGRLPHASVAILIDAVRGSVLPGDDKCRFLFELFDVEKNGSLTRDGVLQFIEATFLASNLQLYGTVQAEEIVAKLFQNTANPERMTYREFCFAFNTVLESPDQTPLLEEKLGAERATRVSHVQDYKTKKPGSKFTGPAKLPAFVQRLQSQYRKYGAEIHYLIAYVVVMIAAFIIKSLYIAIDPAVGYAPKIAKGFAQIIMVNTLFLLLPMCRNFVTFLRRFAAISSRVPVDQHIEFHKICGVVMLLASLGHTVAWVMIVYYLRTVPHDVWLKSKYAHLTFVREQSIWGLLPRIPIWTGVAMVLVAMIAAPLTHPKIRRGNFNAFWMTHLLFVPFLLLILVHGLAMWVQPPQAFYWVLPPCILYLIEKRYRVTNVFGGQTKILRVRFSQDTAAIYMEKPEGFHYHPGMYMFINVPALSRFEWHPFTISSAPEDDFISVHVRKAGDWTGALHGALKDACTELDAKDTSLTDLEASIREPTSPRLLQDSPYPAVFIDGPVGAPSQDFYRYESVVFVGAGIGVTPFASILRSIVHQWEAFRCDRCDKVKLPKTFKLKKIYFYWITREQEALTWFAETMNQLSAMDPEGRLEIHNYYSPLKRESVIAPLHALQKFVHDVDGQDIISGLTTKQMTHFGRPDWKKELQRIAEQQEMRQQVTVGTKKRHVGVFFCGPKPMGKGIHEDCAAFNGDHTRSCPSVVYSFHSENF